MKTSAFVVAGVFLSLAGCGPGPDLPEEVASARSALVYTTSPDMKPTALEVRLVLNAVPIHNDFTRYLTFRNQAGAEKSVAVDFVKTSDLHYQGTAGATALATLQTLADANNRSYWDAMYFENKGGTTALDINQMFVDIEYAQTCCGREPSSQIGYMVGQYLAPGNDSFYIAAYVGRRNYAQDYLGLTYAAFSALPASFRYFVYDIGKSGSSDSTDSTAVNPKYGLSGQALCSETVSWYYSQYEPVGFRDAFRDISSHAVMHDLFRDAGRLYCYHSGRQQWIKKDSSYNWVLTDTYVPRAGDYLDRRDSDGDSSNGDDGHAMMLASWNAATGVAVTLDGPWNINFRPVNVAAEEASGLHDYCAGRIPEND
ncbi:MAG TPA: hypothetical protein VFA20_26665 [Myxococcaceae bacterium]|nr:hypothetical protein [Myxococcaceae bacterium]